MSTGNKTEVAPTMPAADAPVFKRKRQKVWTSRRKDDDISTLFMPINQAREIWRRPRKRFPDIGIELGAARSGFSHHTYVFMLTPIITMLNKLHTFHFHVIYLIRSIQQEQR